ncbi:MAG: glycosyltransferase [Clostridia bacterium]|nr:glycosyltransferase [Clostridia bacterium]
MLKSMLMCIICIFAVFGIVCFVYAVIKQTVSHTPVVLGVHNKENSIECELRQIMLQQPGSEIIVVDMGSTDKTKKIVNKLCEDYPQIRLVCTDCEDEVAQIIREYRKKYAEEKK